MKPKRIFQDRDGITLIDFGRNMAGIVKIGPFTAKEGQKVVIRHGELIQNDKLYTGNLRTAKQTLTYISQRGCQRVSAGILLYGISVYFRGGYGGI